ncbi:MAG: hypothetical protein A2X34_08590 [Elusimicrobia bacterium GWC2_51_8]|nr:MAG: hypothetical protein A2X33_07935 [Elusimicrobia bacterium GWA2_51_34]OGR58114.1 MAG: hypothetical protein A2X34_08590 [Elusimicrobia bacterium GWC2_51_8]OGR87012.1 MAG: hypothetical protein A2021_04075 [Elusimicrobia bacterium GWF2_52_66]HAF95121.1 hypothetical protein [Elusimicrobiota bacterium]HCE98602.1 hypothetical protein [Elusimicrobiota bacterium]
MKNKLVMLFGALALITAPAMFLRAQEGPEGEDAGEIEAWEGGRQPGMAPGGAGPARAMKHKAKGTMHMAWMERDEESGPGRMTGNVRKMMGGQNFLSEEETLAVIKKHDAVFAKKVEDLKIIVPPKYRMVLQMAGRLLAASKIEGDEAAEKDAVRMLALEFGCKELSLKFDKASDAGKKGVKEALKANLSELFDLKSKGQELRVKRMEAGLIKLRKNLEKRKVNKDKIVEQRLGQLTGEGYGW